MPGKCYVEPVAILTGGKIETVRYRLVADGKNYYSNPHKLRVVINPKSVKAAQHDDWTITYGTTDFLRKIITGKIKFNRPETTFLPKGISSAKVIAISSLAKPWHSPSKSIPILNQVIKTGAKYYVQTALAAKKEILQRQAKAKKSDAS